MTVQNHTQKKRRATLLMIAGIIALVIIARAVLHASDAGMPKGAAFGLLLATCGLAFWAMMPWWKRLDHMQKDAQYESWYWGGTIGATVGIVAIIIFAGSQSDMTQGACLLFLAQVAGFAICWIYWRIRNGGGGL